MVACRRTRGLSVAGGDGVHDADVLFPGVRSALRGAEAEDPVHVVVHGCRQRRQPAVAADLDDGEVQGAVQLGDQIEVLGLGGRARVLQQLPQPRDVLFGRPLGSQPGGERLKPLPYCEQVPDRCLVKGRHDGTASGQDLHEPFGLDNPQRLADRVARHTEVVGQPVLGQPLALGVVTVDDPPTELGQYLVPEREVVTADRARAISPVPLIHPDSPLGLPWFRSTLPAGRGPGPQPDRGSQLPAGIGGGYVAALSITITPLTDPDYRPFSRRLAWLASDGDGNPCGSAYLTLHNRPSQVHLAELELAVHPAERRQGVGSQLLAAVADAARAGEARIVLADAVVGSAGDHFLSQRGFTVGFTLIFTRLPLAEVDNAVLAAVLKAEHPGYRLVSWRGVVPEELGQTFTDARSAMDDAPVGDIDYGPDVWDLARTKAAALRIEQRGEHLMTVAAIDEASGRIAGFTELVVPADGTGDAQNYSTAVLKEHRGRGLSRWLKAESIRQAQEQFPNLDGLLTDMVDTNAPMRQVNATLGYRPTHKTHRYKLTL